MFGLPLVPMVFGFDPRLQFVHEDDIVHGLEHATLSLIPGVYNVAGDGVLALSEVIGLLGKRLWSVLPPMGTATVLAPPRRFRPANPRRDFNLLRFGRGVDNRLYKATGFDYGYTRARRCSTSPSTCGWSRCCGATSSATAEREVEEFLRWSPHVRRGRPEDEGAAEVIGSRSESEGRIAA